MYYSTNGKAPRADLRKAVVKGLAEDRGLYMPERIPQLPDTFFRTMGERSFVENAAVVAEAFFGEDIAPEELRRIVEETLAFDCPLREVEPGIYALELFHGPTLAFKDVGARFMARLLRHFTRGEGGSTCWSPRRATRAVPSPTASWAWRASACSCSTRKGR